MKKVFYSSILILFLCNNSLSADWWLTKWLKNDFEDIAYHYAANDSISKRSIGVAPLVSLKGQKSVFGNTASERIINQLIKLSKGSTEFKVFERFRLDDIEYEMEFGKIGRINLSSEKNKNDMQYQMLDFLIVGTYEVDDKNIILRTRMVNVKTKIDVDIFEVEIEDNENLKRQCRAKPVENQEMARMISLSGEDSYDEESVISLLLFKIGKDRKKQKFSLNEPNVFKLGEEMGFSVYLSKPGFLYVLASDELGNACFLYPLASSPIKKFKKDNTYFFPESFENNPDEETYISVEPPTGRVVFQVILSSYDIKLCEGLNAVEGVYFLDREKLNKILSKLNILPSGSWWEKRIEFWIDS